MKNQEVYLKKVDEAVDTCLYILNLRKQFNCLKEMASAMFMITGENVQTNQ